MSRALVAGGSLGGLTAALVLRDQGWDVDVLERSAVPLQDRGAGIVLHPITVRYLVERVGKAIGDIGVPASRLRYLGDDGSVAHDNPAHIGSRRISSCTEVCWTPSAPSTTTCRLSLRTWTTGPMKWRCHRPTVIRSICSREQVSIAVAVLLRARRARPLVSRRLIQAAGWQPIRWRERRSTWGSWDPAR
jgi:hypothetical protein